MYLSKSFVAIMGAVTVFLLVSFATEEARRIARARRILQDMTGPFPAGLESEITCEPSPTAPLTPGSRQRPVFEVPKPGRTSPQAPPERKDLLLVRRLEYANSH